MNRKICGLALLCLASCNSNSPAGDGGAEDGLSSSATCIQGVDTSVSPESAQVLQPNQATTGYICPRGDQDYYRVTVGPSDKLLHIKLINSAAVAVVNLTYLVLDDKKQTVAAASVSTGSQLEAWHCLAPGQYYVQVQDDGNDAKDGVNSYQLTVASAADSDAAEPNNSVAQAVAANSQGSSGTIACAKDIDYFKTSVAAGQLLQVQLTTPTATSVDLSYVIYDDKNQVVAKDSIADGTKAKAALTAVHAMPRAGTYYVAVSDSGDDDSDPKTAYTLTLQAVAEQDVQDQGARNDTPATATVIGTGVFEKNMTGQIGSKADVDYYRIDGLSTVSVDNPAVIDVLLTYNGPAQVNPAVTLIYPHKPTPCTKDSCCTVLNTAKKFCSNTLDCARISYSCVPQGDLFCADGDCMPNPTTACSTEKRCSGAALCLPEKSCGAEQVIRFDSNPKDVAQLHTAQPLLYPGPWYVRVADYQSDAYEHGKNYTLSIKVRMDPDGSKELNSEYFPDVLISPSISNQAREMHVNAAKKKNLKVTLGTAVSGYISYEGDQDWYVLDNPCPNAECVLKATFTAGANCPAATTPGTGLEFVYEIRNDNGDKKDAFPASPTVGQNGCFGYNCGGGDDQCFLSRGQDAYFLVISDLGHNNWSWSCGYTVTITKEQDGCPQPPCKTYQNECYVP